MVENGLKLSRFGQENLIAAVEKLKERNAGSPMGCVRDRYREGVCGIQ